MSILRAFGLLVLFVLISIIFAPVVWFLRDYTTGESLQVLYYLLTGIPVVAFFAHTKKNIYQTRGISQKLFSFKPVRLKIAICTVISGLGILFCIVFPLSDLIPMPDFLNDFDIGVGWLSFCLMVFIAPIVEEIMYRGVILDCLLFRYTPVVSILISSIIFGLAHLNPWQFIAGLIVGSMSGYLYIKYRNLTLNIILHSSINLIGYLSLYFFGEYTRYTDIYKVFSNIPTMILVGLLMFFSGLFVIIKDNVTAADS